MTTGSKQQSVLYIEDTPDHLVLVQVLLERKLKVLVEVASTSAGAELRLNERCFDLIISDYNIPGELGDVIAERVLERDPEQPFMMLTEYMRPELKAFCDRLHIPLMAKFSDTDPGAFVEFVRGLLKEHYCENRRKKPICAIKFTSPHVEEAHDSLLRESAMLNQADCG